MNYLKKKILENKHLRWLLVLTNWLYQGIPHADKSEKIYKIISILLFSLGSFVFLSHSNLFYRIFYSFLIGHSLNWIVNSNQSVIFIHRMRWLNTSPEKLFLHLETIQRRLVKKDCILFSVSLGGISRGTMNNHSDIDVTVIRKPGFKNALCALVLGTIEKKRADFNGIPLDFMISDSIEDCKLKSGGQNNPVVLYDPYNMVERYYNEKMDINEAKKLNKVK